MSDPHTVGARNTVLRYVMRLIDYGKGQSNAELDGLNLGQVADKIIEAATPEITENTSDGFHTFGELYEARMLYHALWVNTSQAFAYAIISDSDLPASAGYDHVKSWRHSDGEECFGGGWFIVVSQTPSGQISQHYKAEHWDLFKCPSVDTPPTYDNHTNADVLARLRDLLEA